MYKKLNTKFVTEIFETNIEKTEWFGYYNYDVISRDGQKMLCNRAEFDGRAIEKGDTIDLGWYDLKSGEWHYIDTSDSFNWQQGAMLQWMPGENQEDQVIYNISKDNHFKSVICNIKTGEKKYIDFPTYCVTPDGKYSITLNYERSYWCRAYHYQSVANPDYDVRVAEDDGVFKVNLETNEVERIVDIHDVINMDFQDDFNDAKHWLEHIMINPSGTKFTFLHRFSYGNAYTTRLFIADIDGENLQIIDGWKSNDWSHFGWKGDSAFAIYSVKRNAFQSGYAKQVQKATNSFSLMSIVNKIVHLPVLRVIKDRLKPSDKFYELFEEKDGKFTFVKNYDNKLFGIDGHPSFTKDGKYMITDSYPDANGNQHLYIFNTVTMRGVQVGEFSAPLSGNPASCDLHPKLSFGGKYIVVDTAYSGIHKMVAMEINWEAVEKELK